ncbi:50S ribosomal protein L17 [Candidatus Adlerbacteria bacterium RIFCSPHIGHO2_02_FULL_54_18]|uniref:50S ribosomal protein L17 n=2 Tax=Candidatus Adleribacteriota TaxID=1752736 RepID=A0A1F4Y1I5_9BACT|nr:MAG: 50S ribosomal protein L17 [Candidatus Adlerbacteria bacterium RIFCSPLOWO2_01_FULL_54_21b]OGC87835.1 MAG: 50S ribosomal protein L17 [Candidatus Adlerbacteria bacterium RIFCSPHIGHO2_02_FULL_54_18]
MRHGNVNRKFGREKGQRVALLKSLARSLILRGKMKTSVAKAKEIRPLVEKMITKGMQGTLSSRRQLIAALGDERVAGKLIKTAAGYKGRAGGYLRITKMGPRSGDAAEMALIEFV